MFYPVALLFLGALTLLGPVVALALRARLRPASSGDLPPGADRAATAVAAAVTAAALMFGLAVMFLMFLGAGLGYSDAPNGVPDRVVTQIWIEAWLPSGLVAIIVLVLRLRRRFAALKVTALVSPALFIGFWLAGIAAVSAVELWSEPARPSPASSPASSSGPFLGPCDGTPGPSSTLPPCPSPSPSASFPDSGSPSAPSPTAG